jgi:pyroglutamyl-peptidase
MALLITTFAPWRACHPSNTSDDLIAYLQLEHRLPERVVVARHLPVHFQLAPAQVITQLRQHRPSVVVCCGMAEERPLLSLERYARGQGHTLATGLNLPTLLTHTHWTTISEDAGDYVCNYLYYCVLQHIAAYQLPCHCVFVHVPRLTPYNQKWLADDLAILLKHLDTYEDSKTASVQMQPAMLATLPTPTPETSYRSRKSRG